MAVDEVLAKRGLSPKLAWENIPEMVVFVKALEEVRVRVSAECPAGKFRMLAYAAAILRGIRGYHGIVWATPLLLGPAWPPLLQLSTSNRGVRGKLDWIGRLFVREHVRESGRRALVEARPPSHGWSAHPEGRHRSRSGWHFIVALGHAMGRSAIQLCARELERILRVAFDGGAPQKTLAAEVFCDLMRATRGRLLLGIHGKGQTKQCITAGRYNAMDAGRALFMWLHVAGSISCGFLVSCMRAPLPHLTVHLPSSSLPLFCASLIIVRRLLISVAADLLQVCTRRSIRHVCRNHVRSRH